jgi:hypothetical protein
MAGGAKWRRIALARNARARRWRGSRCVACLFLHFEATTVVAFPAGRRPFNVFSILVAEERRSAEETKSKFLNPKRIRLKPLNDWFFEQLFDHPSALRSCRGDPALRPNRP